MSTFCLPNVTACDQISQAFPLNICILQAIKEWKWEWPGKEANIHTNKPYQVGSCTSSLSNFKTKVDVNSLREHAVKFN